MARAQERSAAERERQQDDEGDGHGTHRLLAPGLRRAARRHGGEQHGRARRVEDHQQGDEQEDPDDDGNLGEGRQSRHPLEERGEHVRVLPFEYVGGLGCFNLATDG